MGDLIIEEFAPLPTFPTFSNIGFLFSFIIVSFLDPAKSRLVPFCRRVFLARFLNFRHLLYLHLILPSRHRAKILLAINDYVAASWA